MEKIIVFNRNTPYMSKKELMEELSVSKSYLDKLINGIREHIGKRYSPYAIAGERFNYYVVIDFMTFRESLGDKNLSKYVPPFDPEEIAKYSGFCKQIRRI